LRRRFPPGSDGGLAPRGRTELPATPATRSFEYDLPSGRLWLAAEDHGTLDLFDLKTGALRKPSAAWWNAHGIFYLPQKKRLIVTDSAARRWPRGSSRHGKRTLQLPLPPPIR